MRGLSTQLACAGDSPYPGPRQIAFLTRLMDHIKRTTGKLDIVKYKTGPVLLQNELTLRLTKYIQVLLSADQPLLALVFEQRLA